MCPLFRNIYRVDSSRYSGYDYSSPGKYFVTICTKGRIAFFGRIENGKIILSESGIIAQKYWLEIPKHFHFVDLDDYIIMPEHVHGIIIIKSRDIPVETLHATSLLPHVQLMDQPCTNNNHFSSISPKSGSLGSIIRSYKSVVSKSIHKIESGFEWQKSYYDHIIRTNFVLRQIRNYIRDNPHNYL